ncbi:hypothetical protein P175DRAFT_0560861 [Aspergillus ochraceoroseus IBT 24754]|uniref:BZIP domain-containing protein n=1 Tax=Aspergillus ochraceoroseus IBT 24754 TaxID=1392256 RepID=A0A2T5LLM6_9EURO|nr:uncharacterized protein P175DRAFT_0560861 [Aspergillus ochraceoroseus IBT 24754]PTU17175.1 hypothetical protein P175DRAFT_0560861 [Aspergillus ochraceoroseus IBT 24754]
MDESEASFSAGYSGKIFQGINTGSCFCAEDMDTTSFSGHHDKTHSRQATVLGSDCWLGNKPWDAMFPENSGCSSPRIMTGSMHYLSSEHPTSAAPASDEGFSQSSSSNLSSPHMPELSINRDSIPSGATEVAQQLADGSQFMQRHKDTERRSQNRQAQRRFRERKEQEKSQLLSNLDKLQAENDRFSERLAQIQRKYLDMETEKRRLQTEVEMLRRWQQKITGLMSDIVQQDQPTDDFLEMISTSCSSTCWQRGMKQSRVFIIMQTLLSVFEEFEFTRPGLHGYKSADAAKKQDQPQEHKEGVGS